MDLTAGGADAALVSDMLCVSCVCALSPCITMKRASTLDLHLLRM